MTSPPAYASTQFAWSSGMRPPITKYGATASMSKEQPLVPPATYDYLRSGWWGGARIVAVPPDESPSNRDQETSPLISDASDPTCNPFTSLCERLGSGLWTDGWLKSSFGITGASDPPSTSPAYLIQRKGVKTFTLVEGPRDHLVRDDIDLYQAKRPLAARIVVESQWPKSVVEH
ncbi:hypothetical protein FRC00_013948, partial [Tulasnella sp. 408]